MNDRKYVKVKRNGLVGYLDEDNTMLHTSSFLTSLSKNDTYEAVTPEEIQHFEAEESRIKTERAERLRKETELLALCGLTHNDFARFRSVELSEDGTELFVATRENGMDQRSVAAIRNQNYKSSHADEFDSTYEWYTFAIPKRTRGEE
jgi:hypothetical protein